MSEDESEEEREQWWLSAENAMESNEDLLRFIQTQHEQEEARRRELLGADLRSGVGSSSSTTSGVGSAMSRGTTDGTSSSGTLFWEPCKHCITPSPLQSPISQIRPGFTCPDPFTELEEYPDLKGLIIQNHGKCSGCQSTFPILDESKKDYTCEFCGIFSCGNVDNCPSKDVSLSKCGDPCTWMNLEWVQGQIGENETTLMVNWMFDEDLWGEPLTLPAVGKMVIDSLREGGKWNSAYRAEAV